MYLSHFSSFRQQIFNSLLQIEKKPTNKSSIEESQ